MDASRLTLAFAILIGAYAFGRFVFGSVARAGDGMAALFVPPDRTLGWPRGIQESDEPWVWRPPVPANRAGVDDEIDDDERRSGRGEGIPPPHGTFVVAVGPVAPVRVIVLLH